MYNPLQLPYCISSTSFEPSSDVERKAKSNEICKWVQSQVHTI